MGGGTLTWSDLTGSQSRESSGSAYLWRLIHPTRNNRGARIREEEVKINIGHVNFIKAARYGNIMSADIIETTCRLCKLSLLNDKKIISHSRLLYSSKEERVLSERFRDVGVTIPSRPGVCSGRICMKCFRQLENVEKAQNIVKKWLSDSDSTEANGDTNREKRQRTPIKTPRQKKHCQRPNPGSRVSTTEVNNIAYGHVEMV